MQRNRLTYLALTIGVLLAGLASRRFAGEVSFVRAYLGDVLWALMVYLGLAVIARRQPTRVVASLALLVSFGIELSQLYHAPGIDSLRATRLGGLVLGYSFVWSDLLCYSVGIAVGAGLDTWIQSKR